MISSLSLLESHFAVVRLILQRIPPKAFPWALTGSAGLRLQGVEVPVDDLDLQTDRQGAQEITRRFADVVEEPLHYWKTERMRSYFSVLKVNEIRVEVMGQIRKRMPDGSWETPVAIDRVRSWIEVEGLRIPVVDLSHELGAYEILGRIEVVNRIQQVLAARGRVEHV
jgi:hypothetical protein